MSRSLFSAVALVIVTVLFTSGCASDVRSEADVRASTLLVVTVPWKQKPPFTQITGTAFPLGNGYFATAAHTISDYAGSRYSNLVLKDDKGASYEIRQIVSYSDVQDFAVLLVDGVPPSLSLLPREGALEQGTPVRFFGHEMPEETAKKKGIQPGCGPPGTLQADARNIQIGCGTYERTDPADRGSPSWIRFNGSVWKGLSGGPLTDTSWKVIGAVSSAMPSDASRAVPIDVIRNASRNTARINHKPLIDRLRVLDLVGDLPDSYVNLSPAASLPVFSHAVQESREEAFKESLGKHLQKRAEEFVMTGVDAVKYCEILNGESCSCPGPQPSSRLFDVEAVPPLLEAALRSGEPVKLNLRGPVAVRRDGDGRDVELDEAFHRQLAVFGRGDPTLEAVVKALSPTALIFDPEPGSPELGEYTDKRSRKWVQRIWSMDGEDYVLVSIARNVRGGAVVLMNMVPTAGKNGAILQLRIAANLSYACAGN